jgi:hypothetical protein
LPARADRFSTSRGRAVLTAPSTLGIVSVMGAASTASRGLIAALLLASWSCSNPPDVDPGGDDDTPPGGLGYQLLAVRPAMAAAGDTLTLEGSFGDTATVQFPGGTVQTATLLGKHRATVIVPEGATAGDLTVTSAGTTLGPLTFRRVSFALGLQPFRISYDQTAGARQSPQLRIARFGATASVTSSWVYVVGGTASTGPVHSVELAATNADGTLDAFDLANASLVQARSGHTATVIGNSLYVVGGTGVSRLLGTVERAAISSDGSLGPFATVFDSELNTGRTGHASVMLGSFLYVIGGEITGGGKLGSIERAPIRRDGSLGQFAPIDATLTVPRSGHTVEVIGNTLYVIGGSADRDQVSRIIERAAISGDGSIGAFAPSGTTLEAARTSHQSVVLGGTVYVLGGATLGGITSGIEQAPINLDGSLDLCGPSATSILRAPRRGAAIAVVNNQLHVIGGRDLTGPIASVEHASLSASSDIGPFGEANISLVEERTHFTTTVVRDTAYVIGSGTGTTLERATVHPDGSLAPPTTVAGISLAAPRSEHCVAVAQHSLYIIGGTTDHITSSIERTTIDSDGALARFSPSPVALQIARTGHACFAIGSYLYVLGGINTDGHPTAVERAAINDDGSLNPFEILPGTSLNFGRHLFSVVATDSYVYAMGGLTNDAVNMSSVERSPIRSDGSLGPFTVVLPLNTGRGIYTSTVVGNALYVIGGLTPDGFVKSVERADIYSNGRLGDFTTSQTLSVNRARHSAIAVGNSFYLLGGDTELPGGTTEAAVMLDHAELH